MTGKPLGLLAGDDEPRIEFSDYEEGTNLPINLKVRSDCLGGRTYFRAKLINV